VPPKQSACRFFTTRALSRTVKLALVSTISISPKAANRVCSSASMANWLFGKIGQARVIATDKRIKETVAPESNVILSG
jgi:hypothetical protein